MTTSVDRWLQTFMCQKYVDVFESWGYKTLQSVCRLEVEHLRAMGVLPEDCEKIMENVTILRQSLSAQCQSPPARFPDPMANPASSALMSMSRSASQRAMEVIQPPVDQFTPPNVPGYPQMPPGGNYEEFHPRFSGSDPSRYPYPQRPPGPWERGQMGYPPQMRFMGPPPPHGKGWPRMPGTSAPMGPMYGAGMPGPPGMGIYRGYRPPQDPQQVADDIVNMTSQRYSQPRLNLAPGSAASKPADAQAATTSQAAPHFPSPGQVSGIGPAPAAPPPNMRRYRLGTPQNSTTPHRGPLSATGQPLMGPCTGPQMIPGEVSPSSGFPGAPYVCDGATASPMSPHSMASPGSVYSCNSSMYNAGGPHPSYHPAGTSPLSGGIMSPPMMGAMTTTSRSGPMMQQEFTPHIPSISEESEMMARESPVLSKASTSSPNLSSCSYSTSTNSTPTQTPVNTTSTHSAAPVLSVYKGKSSGAAQTKVSRRGDPLQSLHKLAMFTNSQVVDPKSVVHDACFSGAGGGSTMEEGLEKFNDIGQSKNCSSGSSVAGMAELSQHLEVMEAVSNRRQSYSNHAGVKDDRSPASEKSSHMASAGTEVVDFTSKLMASPKPEDSPPNCDQMRSGESEGCHLDATDVDVKMDLDLLLPDDLPAFSNSLEQNLGKKDGELDLWGSDKMDEKWDSLFDIPDLYTSNLVDNREKDHGNMFESSENSAAKANVKDASENEMSPSKTDPLKNIAQDNPLISDLLSDSGDQDSTRSRSCSPQKRVPKEKKKPAKTKAKKAKMKSDEETSGPDMPVLSGPPAMRPPPEYPYGGNNPYLPSYSNYYHPQSSMGHHHHPPGHQPPTSGQIHSAPQSCDGPTMYGGYNNPHQQGYMQCSGTPVKNECPSNSVSDASPASTTDMSPVSSITATSPLSQQQAKSALEARKRRRVRNFVTPRANLHKSESLSSPSPGGTSNPLDSHFPELGSSKSSSSEDNNKDLCLKVRDSSNPLRRSRDLECFPQRHTDKSCDANGDVVKVAGNNNLASKPQRAVSQGSRVENNNSISYSGVGQTNTNPLVSRDRNCERQPENTPIERSPFLCLGGSNKEPPDKNGEHHPPPPRESSSTDTHNKGKHSSNRNHKGMNSMVSYSESVMDRNKSVMSNDQPKPQQTAFRLLDGTHGRRGNDSGETNNVGSNESLSSGCSVISYPLVTCPPVHKSLHSVTVTKSLPRVSIPVGVISSLSHDIADIAGLSIVPDINGNLQVLKDAPSVLCTEKPCTSSKSQYLAPSHVKSECRSIESEGICHDTGDVRTVSVNRNLLKGCSCSQGLRFVSKEIPDHLTAQQLLELLLVLKSRLDLLDNNKSRICIPPCSTVQDANGNFCNKDRNMVRLGGNSVVEQLLKCVKFLDQVDRDKRLSKPSEVSRASVCEQTLTKGDQNHCQAARNESMSHHMQMCKLAYGKTSVLREVGKLTDWELNQINDCLSEFRSRKLNDNDFNYSHRKGISLPGFFSIKELYKDFSFFNANLNITALPVVETDNLPSIVQTAGDLEAEAMPNANDKRNTSDKTQEGGLTEDSSKTNGRVHTSSVDKVPNSSNSITSSPTKSLKATSPIADDSSPRRQSLRHRQLKARPSENGIDMTESDRRSSHGTPVKVGRDGRTVDTIALSEEDGSLITITINDSSNSVPASENYQHAAESDDEMAYTGNNRAATDSPHFSMEQIREMSKQVDIPIEIPLEIISIVKNDQMGSPGALDIKTFNASLCHSEKYVFDGDLQLSVVKEEIDAALSVDVKLEDGEPSQTEDVTCVKQEQVDCESADSPKTKNKKKSHKRKRKSEQWNEDSNDEESFKKLNLSKTFGLFKSGKIKKPKLEKPVKGKNLKKEKKLKDKAMTESDKGQSVGPVVRVTGPKDLPTECRVINVTDQDMDSKARSGRGSTNVPQVSYELDPTVPFVCSICGHPSSYEDLGDLFGPYYPKGKSNVIEKKYKKGMQKSTQKVAAIGSGSPKLKPNKKKKEKSPERPKRNKKKSLDSMEWECESQVKATKKKDIEEKKPKTATKASTPGQKRKSTPKSTCKKGNKAIKECLVIDLTGDDAQPEKGQKKMVTANSPKVVSTKVKKSSTTSATTPKNNTSTPGTNGQQSSSKKKKSSSQQGKKTPAKSDAKGSAQKKMVASSAKREENACSSPIAAEAAVLKELWFHEDCLIWTSGVYLVGGHIHGIEEAVLHSKNTFCGSCKKTGGTLGCFNKGCGQTFHFLCAKEAGCYFDVETYSVYCTKHKEKKMKLAVQS